MGESAYLGLRRLALRLNISLAAALLGAMAGVIGCVLVWRLSGDSTPSHSQASLHTPSLPPARYPTQPAAASPAPPVPPLAPAAAATTTAAESRTEIASEAACPNQSQAELPAEAQLNAVVCLVNAARQFHGLQPVSADGPLMIAASVKAADLVRCDFSHYACGRPFDYWMRQYGPVGPCSSENLAKGQTTARQVVGDWLHSSGHRANILKPEQTIIGVARLGAGSQTVWVQNFGGC